MPITDAEWVFRCTNPTDITDCTKGICKGMVMMFIRAVAGMVDDRNWFQQIGNGSFLDPDRRGGFYVNAATLQIQSKAKAIEYRGRLSDTDVNERTIVPLMYRTSGLDAVELTRGYVSPSRGLMIAVRVRAARYEWFHISLRNARGAHCIAIYRPTLRNYMIFDPNAGAIQLLSYTRFSAIMQELFAHGGDDGDGLYAEYNRICVWGVEVEPIDPGALPPPSPPPRR
jgi:hypothetical protein